MNICVISDGYPSDNHMEFTFVKELCEAWAKIGHNVSIIAPQSLTKALIRRTDVLPIYTKASTSESNGIIEVYRPYYFSLGNFGEAYLNVSKIRNKIIDRTLRNLKLKPDIIYGHFWHSGYSGYKYAKRNNIPIFVATGESSIKFSIKSKDEQQFANDVKGIICVSTKNKNESIQKHLTDGKNCIIIPNAVDRGIFFKYPKELVREELGFNKNDFIVIFVGWFIPRKGPDRVAKAMELAQDRSIKAIFIGTAKDGVNILPEYSETIFVGQVDHKILPKYLSAADVFVLPTLQEGCCNAIVEAMSCGLPIISSDLDFNYDLLDEKNSILVDPMNIKQISEAIVSLKENKIKLQTMGKESVRKLQINTIENRAKSILKFFSTNM